MSTIQDKLTYLNDTKQHLKAAIESKGVSVPADTPFRGYADLVESISGGGDVTVSGYVVGEPRELTIPADAWDGTNYTVTFGGFKVGDWGIQIGLPVNDDTTNTQAVIAAALTVPYVSTAEATDTAEAKVTLTFSAVNKPKRDILIAIFGMEVA